MDAEVKRFGQIFRGFLEVDWLNSLQKDAQRERREKTKNANSFELKVGRRRMVFVMLQKNLQLQTQGAAESHLPPDAQ
jgi:hypothetical protein